MNLRVLAILPKGEVSKHIVIMFEGLFVDYLTTLNLDELLSTIYKFRSIEALMLARLLILPFVRL